MKRKVIVLDIILAIIAIVVVVAVVLTKTGIIGATTQKASKGINKAPSEYFGKLVTNYDDDKTTGVDWQIFDYDGTNYYLIASDYISYDNVPNSTKEGAATSNKPSKVDGFEKAVYLENIMNDYKPTLSTPYQGSANLWIAKLQDAGITALNPNISVTDYLLDTDAWKSFAKPTAEYAVGGPTIELYLDSYNKKHGTSFECEIGENQGYQIKKDENSEWQDEMKGVLDNTDSQYVINSDNEASGMWVASPSNLSKSLAISIYSPGSIRNDYYKDSISGLRPVVCLKAGTELQEQSDGTYKIK